MKKKLVAICALVAVMLPTSSQAITYFDDEVPDPFADGKVCQVSQIGSYGSYVYRDPSRFDLVFDPWVDHYWFCRESGYISYADDFDDLSPVERARIASFLERFPAKIPSEQDERRQYFLGRMETVYALRNITIKRRAYILRARAWLYATDPKADIYRKRALELHKEILERNSAEGLDLIDSLYIVGFYSWKLIGPEAGEEYFKLAETTKWTDRDGNEAIGSDYINWLIEDVRNGEADDAKRFSED